jgi:transcriptional regulator with XRE-family HTH domain
MMRLEDVTPDWIRARMRALALSQSELSDHIGLTQDKLSKSLTGKRRFLTGELDALARILCDPDPEELPAPEVIALARRIEALGDAGRTALEALVQTLESLRPQEHPEDEEPPRDHPG